MAELDQTSFDGTLADGATETLELDSNRADTIIVYVDDGTKDGTPASYDLTVRGYSDALARYQFYMTQWSRTDRSWRLDAVGKKTEIEIGNTSGSEATFHVTVESRRGAE